MRVVRRRLRRPFRPAADERIDGFAPAIAAMSAIEALLLGLVQGLSEFFPVSSSGHLLLLQELLGIHEEGILFEVAVHVATLLSVM